MKTEHLQYFIDTSKTKSLSQTANNFFTSHQVIKNAFKNLEDELMVKLITSDNKGSVLTKEGEILLRYAQKIDSLVNELKLELSSYAQPPQKPKQTIDLCMTPYLTDSMILNFVDEYQKKMPDIVINLQSLPFDNMYNRLTNPYSVFIIPTIEEATKAADFKQVLRQKNLTFFVLAIRPLFVCAYEKSPWSKKEIFLEKELQEIPIFVSSNSTLNTSFISAENHQLVNSITAQKNLLKKSRGISLVTHKEFNFYFKNENKFVIIPTKLPPVWYICIHRLNIEFPLYIKTFLKQLTTVL